MNHENELIINEKCTYVCGSLFCLACWLGQRRDDEKRDRAWTHTKARRIAHCNALHFSFLRLTMNWTARPNNCSRDTHNKLMETWIKNNKRTNKNWSQNVSRRSRIAHCRPHNSMEVNRCLSLGFVCRLHECIHVDGWDSLNRVILCDRVNIFYVFLDWNLWCEFVAELCSSEKNQFQPPSDLAYYRRFRTQATHDRSRNQRMHLSYIFVPRIRGTLCAMHFNDDETMARELSRVESSPYIKPPTSSRCGKRISHFH